MLNKLAFSRNSESALLAFNIEPHGKIALCTLQSLSKSSLRAGLSDNTLPCTPCLHPQNTHLHFSIQFKKRNITITLNPLWDPPNSFSFPLSWILGLSSPCLLLKNRSIYYIYLYPYTFYFSFMWFWVLQCYFIMWLFLYVISVHNWKNFFR